MVSRKNEGYESLFGKISNRPEFEDEQRLIHIATLVIKEAEIVSGIKATSEKPEDLAKTVGDLSQTDQIQFAMCNDILKTLTAWRSLRMLQNDFNYVVDSKKKGK